jgi:hypothetical protein
MCIADTPQDACFKKNLDLTRIETKIQVLAKCAKMRKCRKHFFWKYQEWCAKSNENKEQMHEVMRRKQDSIKFVRQVTLLEFEF